MTNRIECSELPLNTQYGRSKVGFPIRKSLDQSSFAAPQGLSQRTTSFIASQRQGIHRMLLRHLIASMIDVRSRPAAASADDDPDVSRSKKQKDRSPSPLGNSDLMLAEHDRCRPALAATTATFPLNDVDFADPHDPRGSAQMANVCFPDANPCHPRPDRGE